MTLELIIVTIGYGIAILVSIVVLVKQLKRTKRENRAMELELINIKRRTGERLTPEELKLAKKLEEFTI